MKLWNGLDEAVQKLLALESKSPPRALQAKMSLISTEISVSVSFSKHKEHVETSTSSLKEEPTDAPLPPLPSTPRKALSSKFDWSEWKEADKTGKKLDIYVMKWRIAKVKGMIVIDTMLFNENIVRRMIPSMFITAILGKKTKDKVTHCVEITCSDYPDVVFRFADSDSALEFQMDMIHTLYVISCCVIHNLLKQKPNKKMKP